MNSFGCGETKIVSRYIYTLEDPRNGDIKYVGESKNPTIRMRQHLGGRDATTGKWVQALVAAGTLPVMKIVEEIWGTNEKYSPESAKSLALFAERMRICGLMKAGYLLLNAAPIMWDSDKKICRRFGS